MLDTYDEQKAKQIFAHFIRNQTWQVPTLEIKWTQTFIDDLSQSSDPGLKYIPQSEQQWWSPQKNFFARYRTPEHRFQEETFSKRAGTGGRDAPRGRSVHDRNRPKRRVYIRRF